MDVREMTTLDIILFCYNQEQYIEQALRSIYEQELSKDISVRIIVADDCSRDGTLSVIKRLIHESPFPVVFLPEEPNLGISKNYKRSFAATKADYVAILEGDDYWFPNHLAQHVEFLQSHPECSMSMNEITFLHEETREQSIGVMVKGKNVTHIMVDLHKQIEKGNQLGNLSACVFRGQCLRELPSGLFEMPIADWMLGVMMAQRGLIGILRGSTSVYRVKASGVWAGRSRWRQHLAMLKDANIYDRFQEGKYHSEWQQFKRNCWRDVRHNWMHYMPVWVQNVCHKVKRK